MLVADVCFLAIAGGPPPGPYNTILFVVVAVGLTALLAISPSAQERRPPLPVTLLLVAIAALPALQLVPLPPVLWRSLPGGDLREAVLTLVGGQRSWQPLSLVPVETASAALLAFCFAVLTATMIALRNRRFDQLLMALAAIALVNVSLGILQAASGGSPRILTKADHGALLGFFANKNHIGVAIAATLALCVYLVELFPSVRARKDMWLFAATLLAVVCVVPTNSRAGFLLTLSVGLWVVLRVVAVGRTRTRTRLAIVGGGAALLVLLSLSPVADGVYRRFGDVGQDLRWRFLEQSWPLAQNYGLLGTGGGGFSRLFVVQERLRWVKPTIVNETHDEYLQTVIEYGIPGVTLLAVAIGVLGWLGIRAWRQTGPGSLERRRVEVGAVIVLLFVIHSAIDYPLRRPASWALFAAGCALIVRAARPSPAVREA